MRRWWLWRSTNTASHIMARARRLATLIALITAGPSAHAIRSFGRGYDARVCMGAEAPVFSHAIAQPGKYMGVMDHFWTTGSSEE